MSKAPSAARNNKASKRHDALLSEYTPTTTSHVRAQPHAKAGRFKSNTADIDDESYNVDNPSEFMSGRDAKRLMKVAAEQRKEEGSDSADLDRINAALSRNGKGGRSAAGAGGAGSDVTARALLGGSAAGGDNSDDDLLFDDDDEDGEDEQQSGDEEELADDDDVDALGGMTDADRAALEAIMPARSDKRQTLADVILEKIEARNRALELGIVPTAEENSVEGRASAPPNVVAAYQRVGGYLAKYRSGKIPKIFKIIPTLKNWEEILYYTNPQAWSYHSVAAATKLFATALNPKLAQRFYSLVLLPRIENALETEAKLNPHLYEALRHSVYKPAAFFKGIILPLAQRGCPLKVALVFSSVLRRIPIPTMHSAVAIMKLTTIKPFSGSAGLFLKTLVRKRYALPLPTLAAIVEYFYSFIQDGLEYPILWYQNILSFVQRYKDSLSDDQKAMIRTLVRRKHHHIMTEEIRRELSARATGTTGNASVYRASEDAAIDAEMRRGADAAETGGEFFMDSLMAD